MGQTTQQKQMSYPFDRINYDAITFNSRHYTFIRDFANTQSKFPLAPPVVSSPLPVIPGLIKISILGLGVGLLRMVIQSRSCSY